MRTWVISVFIVYLATFACSADEAPPTEVARAAATGLPVFLGYIPASMAADYGFETVAETDRARLGTPFRLATITPQALLAYRIGDDPEALLSDTMLWYYPVAVDGVVRCMLVVDLMPTGWEAVSLGYVPLARALDGLLRTWPESGGQRPRIVEVFQAREYLYTVPGQATPNLTTLNVVGSGGAGSAAAGAAASRAALTPAETTLLRLRPLVEQNLQSFGAAGEER